jgi:hypothetical protein
VPRGCGPPQLVAAFSCVTEVEQRPQREDEPHNRNSEPPAILLYHERAPPSLLQVRRMIAFRFRVNCALHHVPCKKGAPGAKRGGPVGFLKQNLIGIGGLRTDIRTVPAFPHPGTHRPQFTPSPPATKLGPIS